MDTQAFKLDRSSQDTQLEFLGFKRIKKHGNEILSTIADVDINRAIVHDHAQLEPPVVRRERNFETLATQLALTHVVADSFAAHGEFNLLRAAKGDRLICRSSVLKSGKQLTVVESEIYCAGSETEKLVSKATVTIAVVTL
jgi:hypothetical protein